MQNAKIWLTSTHCKAAAASAEKMNHPESAGHTLFIYAVNDSVEWMRLRSSK
jgi:hypothetical protein